MPDPCPQLYPAQHCMWPVGYIRHQGNTKKTMHFCTVFYIFSHRIRNKITDVIRNATATTDVYLLSKASSVLPLFFPKNVSAPPAIDPERPADLADWRSTTTTMEIEKIICKIVTIIWPAFKIKHLLKNQQNRLYHISCEKTSKRSIYSSG
jgi:hypothetical protein